MTDLRTAILRAQSIVQHIALLLFVLIAIFLVTATGLALAGVWPWPDLSLSLNGAPLPDAGKWAQIALTGFMLSLCFFLPSSSRILRLENTHRSFSINMDDIRRAYVAAHAADREGVFTLAEEFDQMRARLHALRDHPDLGELEPELLEVAAQMSFESRTLAQRYSDLNVDRARSFLVQRQQELRAFNDRIEHAKAINSEFKNWINRIELDEAVAVSQMKRLIEELERVLPELNEPEPPLVDNKVMKLPTRAD